jgi:cellulose biosynthesis protein BcsQ
MKTIAIVSQKGGVGKTTTAINIGFAAHEAGLKTAIIDLDPQGTAAKWGDRRDVDGPSVIGGQASRLAVILETARANGADLATFRRKIDGRRRVGFGARRGWILQTGTVLGRAPPPPRQ